ncbi:hypothetical protein [Polyangium sp. 6x1]|uniref:hypothetical protein n=1 Tax=Polyangium sp. 6x1 TaxID=3042689 RepID=UPI00248267C1|nr:hypothetical protein [Polyangium sp. 6x1]MDI1450767.1 hypothetical protein [Polyangium sp. 6x1]
MRRVSSKTAPAVLQSFVVHLTPSPEGGPSVTARIEPTSEAAAELVGQGFELSDAILDVVSSLLVEIAREEGLEDP